MRVVSKRITLERSAQDTLEVGKEPGTPALACAQPLGLQQAGRRGAQVGGAIPNPAATPCCASESDGTDEPVHKDCAPWVLNGDWALVLGTLGSGSTQPSGGRIRGLLPITALTVSHLALAFSSSKRANSRRSWMVMSSFQMSRAARPMSRMAPVTESSTTRMSGPFGQSEGIGERGWVGLAPWGASLQVWGLPCSPEGFILPR